MIATSALPPFSLSPSVTPSSLVPLIAKNKKKKPRNQARMDIAIRKKNYVHAAHTQVKILQPIRFGKHFMELIKRNELNMLDQKCFIIYLPDP